MADYTNKAQQRMIRLVECLAPHTRTGLALTDVAERMEVAPPTALRDLRNLEAVGWAQQRENSRWAMTAGATRPLLAIRDELHEAMNEINRINSEYLGGEN